MSTSGRIFTHGPCVSLTETSRGRPRDRWQREAEQLGPARLVNLIEQYGFAAILINKKAYDDRAASLLSDFRVAGRAKILAQSGDLVSVELLPAKNPTLPPVFDERWEGLEGDLNENWRWSSGNANLILSNPQRSQKRVRLAFRLHSLQPRLVELYRGPQKIHSAFVDPSGPPPEVDLPLSLLPGDNVFQFRTKQPVRSAGSPNTRSRAFRVIDFKVVE